MVKEFVLREISKRLTHLLLYTNDNRIQRFLTKSYMKRIFICSAFYRACRAFLTIFKLALT
ncbi:hypothetical protein CKA32_002429 [Geitlerinema sp. FC II]|nr:hypothetical protein CKA32_002429 [Geitlerinema sp. FC II]